METKQKYYRLSVTVPVNNKHATGRYIWVYDTEEERNAWILNGYKGFFGTQYCFDVAITEEEAKENFPTELADFLGYEERKLQDKNGE